MIIQNKYTQIIVHNKQKYTLKFVHTVNRQFTNICVYYDHSKQQNRTHKITFTSEKHLNKCNTQRQTHTPLLQFNIRYKALNG